VAKPALTIQLMECAAERSAAVRAVFFVDIGTLVNYKSVVSVEV
jgi:hypothetical protein